MNNNSSIKIYTTSLLMAFALQDASCGQRLFGSNLAKKTFENVVIPFAKAGIRAGLSAGTIVLFNHLIDHFESKKSEINTQNNTQDALITALKIMSKNLQNFQFLNDKETLENKPQNSDNQITTIDGPNNTIPESSPELI